MMIVMGVVALIFIMVFYMWVSEHFEKCLKRSSQMLFLLTTVLSRPRFSQMK